MKFVIKNEEPTLKKPTKFKFVNEEPSPDSLLAEAPSDETKESSLRVKPKLYDPKLYGGVSLLEGLGNVVSAPQRDLWGLIGNLVGQENEPVKRNPVSGETWKSAWKGETGAFPSEVIPPIPGDFKGAGLVRGSQSLLEDIALDPANLLMLGAAGKTNKLKMVEKAVAGGLKNTEEAENLGRILGSGERSLLAKLRVEERKIRNEGRKLLAEGKAEKDIAKVSAAGAFPQRAQLFNEAVTTAKKTKTTPQLGKKLPSVKLKEGESGGVAFNVPFGPTIPILPKLQAGVAERVADPIAKLMAGIRSPVLSSTERITTLKDLEKDARSGISVIDNITNALKKNPDVQEAFRLWRKERKLGWSKPKSSVEERLIKGAKLVDEGYVDDLTSVAKRFGVEKKFGKFLDDLPKQDVFNPDELINTYSSTLKRMIAENVETQVRSMPGVEKNRVPAKIKVNRELSEKEKISNRLSEIEGQLRGTSLTPEERIILSHEHTALIKKTQKIPEPLVYELEAEAPKEIVSGKTTELIPTSDFGFTYDAKTSAKINKSIEELKRLSHPDTPKGAISNTIREANNIARNWITNSSGFIFNNILQDTQLTRHQLGVKLISRDFGKATREAFNALDNKTSLYKEARDYGVLGTSPTSIWEKPPKTKFLSSGEKDSMGKQIYDFVTKEAPGYVGKASEAVASSAERLIVGKNPLKKPHNPLDVSRMALYTHLRQNLGFTAKDASDMVKLNLIDYSDLTNWDRNTGKLFALFYTWIKKGPARIASSIAHRPQTLATPGKIYRASETVHGENAQTQGDLPMSLRKRAPMRIPFDTPDGKPQYIGLSNITNAGTFAEMLGLAVPEKTVGSEVDDGNLTTNLIKGFGKYVGGGAAPVVKVPIGLASGQTLTPWSSRLETYPGQSEIGEQKLGRKLGLDKETAWLLKNLLPQAGMVERVGEKWVGKEDKRYGDVEGNPFAAIMTALQKGTTTVDPEQERIRRAKDFEYLVEAVERDIAKAVSMGDIEAEAELKAKLKRLIDIRKSQGWGQRTDFKWKDFVGADE